MRYFKANEIENKPYIYWNGMATSLEELTDLGLGDDPLVLPENEIPTNIYGVCPLKIVGGELVNRTPLEMSDFEAEYETKENLKNQLNLINGIDTGTFDFDFGVFPMDERSRILYDALKNTPTISDTLIMNYEGKPYTLTNANKAAFLTAYYSKLLELSTPNLPA
jgi:hypothetical protein